MRNPDDAPEPESGEPFLSRWVRKKEEARQAPPPAKQEPDAKSPAPELPPVESLTPESDYRAFFHPKVNEDVRRAALKKLFSDPRFNVMDGLDTYIDDYSKTEPIPPAVMAMMKSAQDILRWAREDKEEFERKEAQQAAAKQKALEPPAAPPVAATSQAPAPQAAPVVPDAPLKDA
jgi:hypothetical protein